MKLLTTAAQIRRELARLVRACSSCELAVAWASAGFDGFQLLVEHNSKIRRMVVGTSFFQTDPTFIEAFQSHPSVRFVLKTDGVFHPKLYFFEKPAGSWECLVGSPNFTSGGLRRNDEAAVLITSQDEGAEEALHQFEALLDSYWRKASAITPSQLQAYRVAWARKQPVLKNLAGKFGSGEAGDKGGAPWEMPRLGMTWTEYYEKVRSETGHHTVQGRLDVLRAIGAVLASRPQFREIDLAGRMKVAGLLDENVGDANFRWFGSMRGVGRFWTAIRTNDENLSSALDLIPAGGQITRENYLAYIEQYKKAFPEGRHGIATATRLLAMKRPDMFVCLDKRNQSALCKDFGIGQGVSYESYWDSIITRVMEATWWNSPRPQSGMEREVWDARVAFLDAIYYDGTPI